MKPKDPNNDAMTNESPQDTTDPELGNEDDVAIEGIADELEGQPTQADHETELAEAQGRALRAQAELENFRKRSRREIEDGKKYATIPLVRDLLPAIDNLERALEAARSDAASGALREGVQMVATQLKAVLANHHCVAIEADGQPFDPNVHEAISELPHPEIERGFVAMVHQVGYRVHDRVVRPAQVIVSSGPAEA